MKQNIHPTWYHGCAVTCSCGNTFAIGSVTETLQVDICDKCHPFFTGEMRFVDRQGRVDKFLKKVQAAQTATKSKKRSKAETTAQQEEAGKSYRQILRDQQVDLKQKTSKSPAKAEAAAVAPQAE
jgi:large subunit ribosomal protein L31